MKTLKTRGHIFSDSNQQLEDYRFIFKKNDLPAFQEKMKEIGLYPFKPTQIEILQINLGKMCNQTCKHCHVDAGPERKEIMTHKTMEVCLEILKNHDIGIVDLTGGAPELNPDFRWFVEEIKKLNRHIIVRCNLTILLAGEKFQSLPEFYALHKVEIVSSLPFYTTLKTDSQRGEGVFDKSIIALKKLNQIGYGIEGSGLTLNLVYNPSGAFLPGNQQSLEADFKRNLQNKYGIVFNNLFTITNMPISRFLDYLHTSGNYEDYMEKLVTSFNPSAAQNVMCRNMISVSWDGFLYDCDFNQMLDLKIASESNHIIDFNMEILKNREIVLNQHCYGCTAGGGSSCGGAITK
ncbi:MAG: arsenosugar biosynthesis radical SAM protein ArsS [Leptospiraceae bacterium]|nr:arsenosugar biosynthesis radical SAM protein ArsS [Leptospiraceae bacterium]